MESTDGARHDGTHFFRAECHDRVHLTQRDFVDSFRTMMRDVDILFSERFDRERVDDTRIRAGTEESIPLRREGARESFRHLTPRGVLHTQEENRRHYASLSSAWCLIDFPSTRKTTSSAMFVARSATRSRLRLTRNSSIAFPMMCGSSIMCVSRIRNID